jgi:cytochrome c peroxidase
MKTFSRILNRQVLPALITASFCCIASAQAETKAQTKARQALKIQLGEKLFFDTRLSNPAGQACASCHDPNHAFSDPNPNQPVSNGVLTSLKGNRNAPAIMYASFTPAFHFSPPEGLFIGGQFLDGRAATLKDQAKGPFLNPLEMANPDAAAVVEKARQAEYAGLFEQVYGPGALDDIEQAYDNLADAIAAFERTGRFRPFTSKYDYFLAGKAKLTPKEKRGRFIFEDGDKGNCAACHPSRTDNGAKPLFTDFTYDNLGVPKNPDNPFYALPADLNPAGKGFVDRGLGGSLKKAAEYGKFKVPTLRNIEITAPYMHNGYFKTLRGVVEFYNSRDTRPACADERVNDTQALADGC